MAWFVAQPVAGEHVGGATADGRIAGSHNDSAYPCMDYTRSTWWCLTEVRTWFESAIQSRAASPLADMPAGAIDCHNHIVGTLQKYPMAANRTYTPPEATVAPIRLNETSAPH